MAGLVLNLKPYEKFLVGGIVMQNGDRRSQLRVVDADAGVLRLTDALHPDEVKTPLTRAYFVAQTMITGDADPDTAPASLGRLLDDAITGFSGFSFVNKLRMARDEAAVGNPYRVLKLLRPLLAKERAVLLTVEDFAQPPEVPVNKVVNG